MNGYFGRVVVADFEYETEGGDYNLVVGDLPKVLCMVAYELGENLQHMRTIRLWRGEFGPKPPFDIGGDTLFVAYSAWAELTIFMTLGWEFPRYVYDLHTAYLGVSNILAPYNPDNPRRREHKRLPDACRTYDIEGWEQIDKAVMAKDIGEGHWRKYGQAATFDYCEEDVRKSTVLFERQLRGRPGLPPMNVKLILHWSNYSAKAVARIQARGMPIDTHLWNLVQENKAAVIRNLLRRFDPSQGSDDPIYTPEGEWSYERFEQYLVGAGITAWPRLESGRLNIDGDAFRLMYHAPGIEGLHALRDSLGVVVRAKLPIGRDKRNRPSLFPLCTATGRNAHAKSLYNAHAGMRSFMVAPLDTTMIYADWRTQEVGVLAALSADQGLMDDYGAGDIYHALAKLCGLTNDDNVKRWKTEHPDMRQRMKSLQLGINYGMGVPNLAKGLNRHPLIASGVIERHKRRYPRAWQYRSERVQAAMLDRCIETEFGWPLRISTSPNERTLYNFPMQANASEMLRLAAWRFCEADIVPSMLIHDGILLEARGQEEIDQALDIMRAAGREVCHGFEIGVDIDQRLEGGARYRDKRQVAQKMWATMMATLQEIGALPEGPIP
jgi:DNA polymerase-1